MAFALISDGHSNKEALEIIKRDFGSKGEVNAIWTDTTIYQAFPQVLRRPYTTKRQIAERRVLPTAVINKGLQQTL